MAARPEANFLQSWYWGQFHLALGKKIHRIGFYDKQGNLKGVTLAIIENAKRGQYLTVPGGPIIDWGDEALKQAFIQKVKDIARLGKCVFIRVRPQLESNNRSKNIFKQLGFISAPIHLHAELTSQMDITLDEEKLLANMRKTTRYEIKKAGSLNIEVNVSDNPVDIKNFYDMQILTSGRQKFIPFSYEFLHEQFKIFSRRGKALLFSARLQNKLLAQAFIIFYGQEAAYHYGASTEEGRKYPGTYLIQWAAIKEAKRRGMKKYNFWGVAPAGQKNHRFYNVSIFKRGFGGSDFEYLHAQDLVISYPRYLINYAVEKIRKYSRRV